KDINKVFDYTNKWNSVAIISDGSRVLGLGDIGPYAGLPVMEGKALIFKYLGGVDAFPIMLNTKDKNKIVETVKIISPTFGGINLEDIEQPKCFYILDRLKKELDIPVWHDDQQGTATVTLAGLINALKIVNKKIKEVKIVILGAGAASVAIARLLTKYGADIGKIIMIDSKGTLHPDREDIRLQKDTYREKWYMCINGNRERIKGGLSEAIKNADVLIAASKPGPGVVKKEDIKKMSSDAIVFAQANPVPEIWPDEAKQAGARIVATGRSDFPNQINNSLCFPGVFRGVLDVKATMITDEMCISAAEAIAKFAQKKSICEEYIVPSMEEWEVYLDIAVEVGIKAIEQGVAINKKVSRKDLYNTAKKIILKARKDIELLNY
ncbi:MAG: NADP-dependent malic enzyme, partial [Endomicrobiia bacterium]